MHNLTIDLSPQQSAALDAVKTWLTPNTKSDQIFRLFGYALTRADKKITIGI